MIIERINRACSAYPCHNNLEDCSLCYCPFYPCKDENKGKWHKTREGKIWDCSQCEWIHKKEVVDDIFKLLNSEYNEQK